MRELVATVIAKAGLGAASRGEMALGVGLAGLSSAQDAARVAAALPGWARVEVANDAVTACIGANGSGDGGLIIAGTGTAGIARIAGAAKIVGGRGFLLGDDGSGARIGADAVRAALRAFDGLEPMSGLSRALLAKFDSDPLRMMKWAQTAKPGDYGAFAPQVFEAARAGESGALEIVGSRRTRDRRDFSRARSARRRADRHRRRRRGAVANLPSPRSRGAAEKAETRRRRRRHPARRRGAAGAGRSAMTITATSQSGGKLYRAVVETLRREIEAGRFAESQLLPGERALCELLEVSRTTLRKAIAELIAEGVLFHRHGAGTFIHRATPRVDQPSSRLTSFTEDMRLRGFEATSRDLERGVSLPTPDEAMMLSVGLNDRVFRLGRLRLANDVPVAIEHAAVPLRYLPDWEGVGASLYEALTERGHRPTRGLQRLRATLLSDAYAELLGVEPRSPALHIQRIAYLADGACVEFTKSWYRADTYDFVSELTLSPPLRKIRG